MSLYSPALAAHEARLAPESSTRRPVHVAPVKRKPGTPVPPDTTTPSGKPLPF